MVVCGMLVESAMLALKLVFHFEVSMSWLRNTESCTSCCSLPIEVPKSPTKMTALVVVAPATTT